MERALANKKAATVGKGQLVWNKKKFLANVGKLMGMTVTAVSVVFIAWFIISVINVNMHNLSPQTATNHPASWNLIVKLVDFAKANGLSK